MSPWTDSERTKVTLGKAGFVKKGCEWDGKQGNMTGGVSASRQPVREACGGQFAANNRGKSRMR